MKQLATDRPLATRRSHTAAPPAGPARKIAPGARGQLATPAATGPRHRRGRAAAEPVPAAPPAEATGAPPRVPPSPGVTLPGKLLHWEIDRLRPYARNPRTHTPDQVTKIAASLLEFGWTNPILVDATGEIIAGHGRLLAARELGMTTVPVIELAHLTDAQKRAYVIADNRLALDAGWDEALLAEELKALGELDFNLELIGFDLDELHDLLEDETEEEPVAPSPPDNPVSVLGDLWILGDHRVLCGDSADAATVDRLLAGAPIHLVNTDPPYNVKVEPRSNNAIAAGLSSFQAAPHGSDASKARHGKKAGLTHHQGFDVARGASHAHATGKMRPKDRPLINDFVSDEAFDVMLFAWFGNIARVLQPGRSFYIWGGYANIANYPAVLKAAGLYFSQSIIWDKQHPVLTRKDFMGAHEWAFYGWREGAAHKFFGPANVPDLWAVKKVNPQSMVHLTEKPVELAVRAMQYSSRPHENVLDLFGGSGSTLMGAQETSRRCFMMELDPAYTDVIVTRWQEATGEKAVLDGPGTSFDDVALERVGAQVE